MSQFVVTIERITIVKIIVPAGTPAAARKAVENYGISEAAVDYPEAEVATGFDRIKSVRRLESEKDAPV